MDLNKNYLALSDFLYRYFDKLPIDKAENHLIELFDQIQRKDSQNRILTEMMSLIIDKHFNQISPNLTVKVLEYLIGNNEHLTVCYDTIAENFNKINDTLRNKLI